MTAAVSFDLHPNVFVVCQRCTRSTSEYDEYMEGSSHELIQF